MKKVTQKAFTLAEIMIVLTVIGILTAIILPSARNLMPDKNLMKFKKAHNTLATAITELVNSDKYYLDGDLGVKPNGDLIDGTHEGDITYLCQTLADVLNTKKVNCSKDISANNNDLQLVQVQQARETIETAGLIVDKSCKIMQKVIGEEIVAFDNVVFYQTAPNSSFGISHQTAVEISQLPAHCTNQGYDMEYCNSKRQYADFNDENNFNRIYKVFCVDIDGIPDGVDETNCVNECPFGYGLRVDGKILSGARALEWLEKSGTE